MLSICNWSEEYLTLAIVINYEAGYIHKTKLYILYDKQLCVTVCCALTFPTT